MAFLVRAQSVECRSDWSSAPPRCAGRNEPPAGRTSEMFAIDSLA